MLRTFKIDDNKLGRFWMNGPFNNDTDEGCQIHSETFSSLTETRSFLSIICNQLLRLCSRALREETNIDALYQCNDSI